MIEPRPSEWNDPLQPGTVIFDKKVATAYDMGAKDANALNPADKAVQTDENCGTWDGSIRTGTWGPLSHTYGKDTTELKPCVVIYDIHLKEGAPKDPKELIAAGEEKSFNEDNSVLKNYTQASVCKVLTLEVPPIVVKGGETTVTRRRCWRLARSRSR